MSVTIRPYRGGGWEVDIRVVSPDGTRQSSASASTRRCRHDRLSGGGLRPGNACCSKDFSLRQRIKHHARRCPPYKSSRRDSSTATHGRIGRSRAGLHRRP